VVRTVADNPPMLLQGVLPGNYCEPMMTTVGSQDTTGPMTR
jgi:aconitate hydratase 2/2-methylisocitrate dehydratase